MLYTNKANFSFYGFAIGIPSIDGASAFDIEIKDGGKSTTNTNGGAGFPLQDAIVPQFDLSCQKYTRDPETFRRNVTVRMVAAVSLFPLASLTVSQNFLTFDRCLTRGPSIKSSL